MACEIRKQLSHHIFTLTRYFGIMEFLYVPPTQKHMIDCQVSTGKKSYVNGFSTQILLFSHQVVISHRLERSSRLELYSLPLLLMVGKSHHTPTEPRQTTQTNHTSIIYYELVFVIVPILFYFFCN